MKNVFYIVCFLLLGSAVLTMTTTCRAQGVRTYVKAVVAPATKPRTAACVAPVAYNYVYNRGAYTIDGSQVGVNYRLAINGTVQPTYVLNCAGTGSALDFSADCSVDLAGYSGTLTIVGIRTVGGCSTVMNGSVTQ